MQPVQLYELVLAAKTVEKSRWLTLQAMQELCPFLDRDGFMDELKSFEDVTEGNEIRNILYLLRSDGVDITYLLERFKTTPNPNLR